MRRMLLLLAVCVLPAAAPALSDLGNFAFDQKLGNQVPLAIFFRDESGETVRLADFIHGMPAILVLGYFHCPNLCGIVRDDLFSALQRTGMVAGRDYTLVAFSIDPRETSEDAREARQQDVARYTAPGAVGAWHFLTGNLSAVEAIEHAVGFRSRFDPALKQFLHPAGIVFITPHGVISSYILGVGYNAGDVRLGVTRASSGSIAAKALPVLLLCFHFDATTGRYTLAIMKLVRLAGALTVLTIGTTLFLAFRRERRRP